MGDAYISHQRTFFGVAMWKKTKPFPVSLSKTLDL